jgi:hypothetical protein
MCKCGETYIYLDVDEVHIYIFLNMLVEDEPEVVSVLAMHSALSPVTCSTGASTGSGLRS